MNINQKIKAVGNVEYSEKTKEDGVKNNIEYVKKIMGKLPETDVINFTKKYGFSYFKNTVCVKSMEGSAFIKDKEIEIGQIYGFGKGDDSVKEIIKTYYTEEQLNRKFFPLFESCPGDIIYYSLEKETFGKIYYWHHESEINERDVKISNSFLRFIETMFYKDSEENDEDGFIEDDINWNEF